MDKGAKGGRSPGGADWLNGLGGVMGSATRVGDRGSTCQGSAGD